MEQEDLPWVGENLLLLISCEIFLSTDHRSYRKLAGKSEVGWGALSIQVCVNCRVLRMAACSSTVGIRGNLAIWVEYFIQYVFRILAPMMRKQVL